ncbi:ABC-three component system middle component 1 [Salinicoccus roseus]|uniref:ABC-three component system middle component 1 n=1 Tax=Salinicoccus roseus TaxID=45670 RepID=UPI002301C8CE|nr:ABC-three component system middle component 1 [Salinicoccus roseus]
MNTYNFTFFRLKEKGFTQDKEALSDIGVALFKNDTVNVVLQNLDVGIDMEYVRKESIDIRRRLHEIGLNVWNTYYILCIEDENFRSDDMLFIERDSSGLRKYVIRHEEDLNRILFLDNLPVNKIENPIKIQDNVSEKDRTIKIIFEFIEKNEGTEKIIPIENIRSLLDEYL